MVFYFSGSSAPAPLVSTTILFRISRSCLLISFFPRSFHRAASVATFYAFWSSPVALCLAVAFISSGFRLDFLALPIFLLSHPSQVSSFLRFVTWAAVFLSQFPHLRNLLAVLRYFWFSSAGELFPFACSFSLSLWFLPRSDLQFPSRHGLPSGRVRFCSALCSSLFSEFLLVFLFLSVWFSCFPLTRSHIRFT